MLQKLFLQHLESELFKMNGLPIVIKSFTGISGGSINAAYCLKTSHGGLFLKVNSADKYPGMFISEMKGLLLLLNSCVLRIPQPILCGSYGNVSFILMEYLEKGKPQSHYWENFAKQLAALHQTTSLSFGLDHANYIGSLKQQNHPREKWSEFFIVNRLEPMIRMGNTDPATNKMFDHLFNKIEDFFPPEQPALLHGDLWSGNRSWDERGQPSVFDPAVYFGHREMDIAMTKLFGGFDELFYDAYNEHFPLEKGWKKRIDVANLYPLMVHVNLFGGSYLSSIRETLKRYN